MNTTVRVWSSSICAAFATGPVCEPNTGGNAGNCLLCMIVDDIVSVSVEFDRFAQGSGGCSATSGDRSLPAILPGYRCSRRF